MPIRDSIILKLHLATWLQWAFTLVLWPAALVAYTVLASFVFTALANLIAGPFNERLSERTEEMVTGKAESSVLTFRQAFGRLGKSFVMQLKKILFFVLLQVLILGTYLIPLFGPIVHAVLAAVVTIWFLASEFLDYPMERREISYRMRLYFAWTHRWEVLGFGIAVAFWLAVPVLGFTALPVSVVGGTLLYLAAIES
ncbi:MAG: EI24 domain-containing protein [Candidatus Wallbacteria bacterium]|nr:EI24 domain-containing protein [Candidatus Wallbacteria bacterium]